MEINDSRSPYTAPRDMALAQQRICGGWAAAAAVPSSQSRNRVVGVNFPSRKQLAAKGGDISAKRSSRVRYSRPHKVLAFAQSGSEVDDGGKASSSPAPTSVQLYGQIERVISDNARRSQAGDSGRWEEVQGAWVLRPSKGDPVAIVHFVGGVFVGASPQLTYRLFLERLAERGFLVIATPFASGFDHLRIADEAQFKFDRCSRQLRSELPDSLPIFGLGHSLGALTQLLIGARYAVERTGNVFLSFNNKEATTAIPLLAPVLAPMAKNFGPLLTQLTASPQLRMGAEMALKQLETLTPPLFRQVLPLVEQLPPLYADLADGKDRFIPSPEDTSRLIKSYYGVGRNLLVRFKDDTIDETLDLAQTLGSESAVSSYLDMSVRTLPGDHTRPLQQILPEVPPVMADAVNRGSRLLESLAAGTPLAAVMKGVSDSASVQLREQVIQDIEKLVDEVAGWMFDSLKLKTRYL